MSITVSLGTNNSDERYLTKNITWSSSATNLTCDVYDPTDRINPIVLLDRSKVDLTNINYMEIAEFGRKYFITNIVGEAGNRVSLYGHVDVLSTYDTDIRNCPFIGGRSTSLYNMYLEDQQRIFNSYIINQYVELDDIGEPSPIIIITA